MASLHFVCRLLECPSTEKEILPYQLNQMEAQMSGQQRKLKMALDFDEVFTQSHKFARDLCLRVTGVHLPLHVYRYSDWENPGLNEERYRDIIFLHNTPPQEWAEKVELMPGVLEGLDTLRASGLAIEILTARGLYEGELEGVTRVLEKHDLSLSVVGTAYQPKVDFLDDHVLILDDQIHELEPISEEVHRLLFSRPHNTAAWQNPKKGIVPVRDWPHAVETIRELLDI